MTEISEALTEAEANLRDALSNVVGAKSFRHRGTPDHARSAAELALSADLQSRILKETLHNLPRHP